MDNIAILLATYNGEKYLAEQLDSLVNQTQQNFIVYVHDDGSSDQTKAVIEKYQNQYPEKIVCLEYPPSGSAKNNFLSLLRRVESEYYMFCDQDDVWKPEKVEILYAQMKRIEKDADKSYAVFSDLQVVDQDLKEINKSFMQYANRNPYQLSLHQLIVQNVAAGCSMMINRKLAESAGKYMDLNNIFMHDWWCVLIAILTGEVRYIEKPLVLYRQHEDNFVGASPNIMKWFAEKAKNIISGNQLKSSKEGIKFQRSMAYELSLLSGLKSEDYAFLSCLANIGERNKIQRILFYRKYKLLRRDCKNFWKIILV